MIISYCDCLKSYFRPIAKCRNVFHFVLLIVGSVRRNRLLTKVTRAEVETIVKLWLRLAVDRSGGRNARTSRGSSRVNTAVDTDYSD
jgi:hypothetical protein